MSLTEGRSVIKQLVFSKNLSGGVLPLSKEYVTSDGDLHDGEHDLFVDCIRGQGAYQVKLSIGRGFLSNAMGARLKLTGWDSIKYLAVGFTLDGKFVHVKVPHVVQGGWQSYSFSFHDLEYLIQNNWAITKPSVISDCRVFVKGTPGLDGGKIALSELALWLEAENAGGGVLVNAEYDRPLLDTIHAYWRACFRKYPSQVDDFLHEGSFPAGDINLNWDVHSKKPLELGAVNTYRFSWHALHFVSMCILRYEDTGQASYLHSARDFVSLWMDSSFFSPDGDQKYAWYDHGTAERSLVLLVVLQIGMKLGFDTRFNSRVAYALFKHAKLLCSEAFYASHQIERYHNHAWFQDIALIAVAISLKHLEISDLWLSRGLGRLKDQLAHLIHRESNYAIFVENSIGYHQGVQRLVGFAGQLESLAGRGSGISNIADELDAWSKDFRYPDGRYPAQGDTFRRANPASRQALEQPESWSKQAIKLPQAGYAVIKGGSIRTPWMFGLLATNLNSTHKHEDDLSFFLWLDGVEWLVDPSFVSHEYKDDIPAYLRSAKAHNMLHVEGAEYSYQPDPDRIVMNITEPSDKGPGLSIEGHNRSCSGYEVVRRLVCTEALELPQIICTDSFWELPATNEGRAPEKEPVGILTFHFGDGVRINSTKKQGAQTLFELSHPASDRRLTLGIGGECDSVNWETSVEASVCGLGFMEHIETQALRIRVPTATECHWFIDVK
ncbi:hypothetical protein FE254_10165 [Ectopseudomonas guguanensis]|uniref:heparinase II/III domain-containing protein n=1 Tax=Ectopseudomonas guguanensis TaxID=1198456 RepID=UPI002577EFF1|nr:heparinase II/III family protein [Pseudomonas guguanensis]WJH56518.1 hypothetical protein FE254_10165 [Pseudomonas guguanensis]